MNNTRTNRDVAFYDTPYGHLPRVTDILSLFDGGKSNALMFWANKVLVEYLKSLADKDGTITIKAAEADEIFKKAKARHKEIKEQAGDVGSAIHNLVEVYLKGQRVEGLLAADERLIKPFGAFIEWQKQSGFEFIATERPICHEYGYAGTLDALAKRDSKVWLIDFKTSNAIRETYLWQIAAYWQCCKSGKYLDKDGWHDSALEIENAGILRLDQKTGLPEWKEYGFMELTDGLDCFMALLHLRSIAGRLRNNGHK